MSCCLIIEDSGAVREILSELLLECGCQTVGAEGPASAISLIRQQAYEAIFLDWDLPDFGALEILRVLNEISATADIILCVTHNDPREMALARAAGGTHILMKPYDSQRVASAVRTIGQDDADTLQQAKSA